MSSGLPQSLGSAPRFETLENRMLLSNPIQGSDSVTLMSQNLYMGAALTPVMTVSSPMQIPAAVTQVWDAVKATNFPSRAKALAKEIAAARPEVLALQEAAIWRQQTPGDAFSAQPTPATDVVYDFVQILRQELRARGVNYRVVSKTTETDVELPDATGSDIRLTDRDVILARSGLHKKGVTFFNAQSGHFNTVLQIPIGGAGGPVFSSTRGWASIDVNDHGRKFRVVDAHLEEDVAAPIQEAQGAELLAGPGNTELATVFVGDFNSKGDDTGTATHRNLIADGFSDAWSITHPNQAGFTWGQAPDLKNATSTLSQRLDMVLYRNGPRALAMKLVGDKPADRTANGLWPSDHAGIVAKLKLAQKSAKARAVRLTARA